MKFKLKILFGVFIFCLVISFQNTYAAINDTYPSSDKTKDVCYHFTASKNGKTSLTLHLGGNGSKEYEDIGNGNVELTNTGFKTDVEANNYVEKEIGCNNYTRSTLAPGIIIYYCNGHGMLYNYVEKNGVMYHFSHRERDPGNLYTIDDAKEFARSFGCDNYEIKSKNYTGRTTYSVTCKGHDKNVYSSEFGNGFDPSLIQTGNVVNNVKITTDKIAGSAIRILKILTIVGIIIIGLKFMYSSSDVRAEMKKVLPLLIIGIVIVFAGEPIINFIVKVFNEIVDWFWYENYSDITAILQKYYKIKKSFFFPKFNRFFYFFFV